MVSGVAPIRARVGHDQPDAHPIWRPASARRDLRDQTAFAIEGPKKLVDVHQFGLELDEDQVPGASVPGQLVDEAALAVDAERHFGLDHPARRVGHECRDGLGES